MSRYHFRQAIGLSISVVLMLAAQARAAVWQGFDKSPYFGEQTRWMHFEPGVRALVIAPGVDQIKPDRPSRVIFFATPNGNTLEQTLGCRMTEGLNWHYDIQHIAAQYRAYRAVDERENLVLVCVQPDIRSWPTWCKRHEDHTELIQGIVKQVLDVIPLKSPHVTLASHSGGGAFMFGFIDGVDVIPDRVDRLIFLDSDYNYDDAKHHGEKFIHWLKADPSHRLVVVAYDDREVTDQGKKIVGPTGGTYRATHRMIDRLQKAGDVKGGRVGVFMAYAAIDGRAHLLIHPNKENIIQHTRLVGEMNGLMYALALDTPEADSVPEIGGPRAYMPWIQAEPYVEKTQTDTAPKHTDNQSQTPTIPPRPADAMPGRAFMKSIEDLTPAERDLAIRKELLRGNVPAFFRRFVTIHTRSKKSDDGELSVTFQASPDYLCVGSDKDFVRVAVTPQTAQVVADAFGCSLPTCKMVDEVYRQATVKLAPLPLTEERQSVTSLLQHNGLIEWQRQGHPLGELVAGIKKDVVITNRLKEKPDRVAIYGWHRLSGQPIQPLTIVHTDTYTDYSHGVRLIQQTIRLGDEPGTVEQTLADPNLAPLLSDEGVIKPARYQTR